MMVIVGFSGCLVKINLNVSPVPAESTCLTKQALAVKLPATVDTGTTMSFISIILIAFAMSMDAFVAAIGKGAGLRDPRLTQALRVGLIFGAIEALTPLAGWALGQVAVKFVSEWDHWIAFVLLVLLGAHMIYEGLKPAEEEVDDKPRQHSFWLLAATGFATSIDALAIGVGLAFIEVNILLAAAAIGIATFVMATTGVMLGRAVGTMIGKKAEIFGGLVLFAVGASILYEHLNAV